MKEKPKQVLEIGCGNGILSYLLTINKIKVTTLDRDKNLNPSFIGDILDIEKFFKEKSFDLVVCFEILEHLPFNKLRLILEKLERISKGKVIISVPHSSIRIAFAFKLPFLKWFSFLISLPYIKKQEENSKEGHYWEIGKRGFSKSRVVKEMKKVFSKVDTFRNPLDSTRRYFILSNKK